MRIAEQSPKTAAWDCQCFWAHCILCPPASCCCFYSALTQKGECHLLSHGCPLSSWVSLEIFNACRGVRWSQTSLYCNTEGLQLVPIALWISQAEAGLEFVCKAPLSKKTSLQPEPLSSHSPTFFLRTWATSFNLGGVEHIAAQQLTESCDLLSLFHCSASSAPDVLADTLIMFFTCIFHSQASCKCYGDCSWFANQVEMLRLSFASRDSCKKDLKGFNLGHRQKPWLLG